MRYVKGKWVASRKDLWHTSVTLDKVILAYLLKLRGGVKDHSGVPIPYVFKQAELQGVDVKGLSDTDDVDLEAATQLRLNDIDELIWTFSDNEPCITDYDFTYTWDTKESDIEGVISVDIQCTNQEESKRYDEDLKVWQERKDKGRKLFGEIYGMLDL